MIYQTLQAQSPTLPAIHPKYRPDPLSSGPVSVAFPFHAPPLPTKYYGAQPGQLFRRSAKDYTHVYVSRKRAAYNRGTDPKPMASTQRMNRGAAWPDIAEVRKGERFGRERVGMTFVCFFFQSYIIVYNIAIIDHSIEYYILIYNRI